MEEREYFDMARKILEDEKKGIESMISFAYIDFFEMGLKVIKRSMDEQGVDPYSEEGKARIRDYSFGYVMAQKEGMGNLGRALIRRDEDYF